MRFRCYQCCGGLWIDVSLLVFNLMPIYSAGRRPKFSDPAVVCAGRGRSLMVTTILGLLGIVGFFGRFVLRSFWSCDSVFYADELLG